MTDTGTGMDRPTMDRIFEPFFTTKEKGHGTGLGLSMVYGIIKQSGGHIVVDSRPGAGTTFKLYLPHTADRLSDATVLMEVPAVLSGTETILVVEDEEMVRHLAGHILRRHGYLVLEAANAGEALLITEQHQGEVGLVLCDIVLPRVSGVELAARLARLRPQTKLLFMTGHSEEATAPHGFPSGELPVLDKPFSPETLLRRVRQRLDEQP
jgi:two-component system cell cycle sensor histidine kinase/response regulator CckA